MPTLSQIPEVLRGNSDVDSERFPALAALCLAANASLDSDDDAYVSVGTLAAQPPPSDIDLDAAFDEALDDDVE